MHGNLMLTRRIRTIDNPPVVVWRNVAAGKYGVPADLLHGDIEEAVNNSAKALKEWGDSFKSKIYAPKITDSSGHPDIKDNPNAELLGKLFGTNQ